jgi:hypothetical protein
MNTPKFQLKKTHLINLFILVLSLCGYYFEYYYSTSCVVFLILCGPYWFSDDFNKDQITIRNHYLENFKTFYYLVFIVRLITFLSYCYFFSLDVGDAKAFSGFFLGINYIFFLVGFIDLGIVLYIIFYKN